MATYRLIVPCMVGQVHYPAGSILQDGRNGEIPDDWVPPLEGIEPIDGDALLKHIEVERRARGRRGG
jgi:hypothetical protein